MGFWDKLKNKLNELNDKAEKWIDENNDDADEEAVEQSGGSTDDIIVNKQQVKIVCDMCEAEIITDNLTAEVDCDHCGATNHNKNYIKKQLGSNYHVYPVLVKKDFDGYMAYDCDYDIYTDCEETVLQALQSFKTEIEQVLTEKVEEGGVLEIPTEQEYLQNVYVKKEIENGAKLKFIKIKVATENDDPNW